MTKSSKNREALELLVDVLVEDILAASDEEILTEVTEDLDDPAREASRIKSIFEKARAKAAKNRLKAAKEAVRQEKQQDSKVVPLDPAAARRKLNEILRSHPDASNLTLAARKAQDELSDTDVLGLLEDLRDLGVSKPEDVHE